MAIQCLYMVGSGNISLASVWWMMWVVVVAIALLMTATLVVEIVGFLIWGLLDFDSFQ